MSNAAKIFDILTTVRTFYINILITLI